MNLHRADNEGTSKVMGLEIEDIPIERANDRDVLDDMEMLPFPNMTVPVEQVEFFEDSSIPMEQKSIYDMLEADYTSAYLYDYPLNTELEADYDMYNFADMEIGQMIEPWESIHDIAYQIEEMNCNNNLENINDYNFVNSRCTYDYSSPKALSNTNEILENIETFNPVIIRRMLTYGIPYDIARRFIRKIVSLTLDYYR